MFHPHGRNEANLMHSRVLHAPSRSLDYTSNSSPVGYMPSSRNSPLTFPAPSDRLSGWTTGPAMSSLLRLGFVS